MRGVRIILSLSISLLLAQSSLASAAYAPATPSRYGRRRGTPGVEASISLGTVSPNGDRVTDLARASMDPDRGAASSAAARVAVDTQAPSFRWLGVSPEPLRRVRPIRFTFRTADDSPTVDLSFEITDARGKLVHRETGISRPPGRTSLRWNARRSGGAPVEPGTYRIRFTVSDEAGNRRVVRPRPFRDERAVRSHPLFRVAGAGRRMALTFDDCGSKRAWTSILRTLADRHVRATFFCPGQSVRRYPKLARRTVARGHTIGAHGWDHKDMTTLGLRGVQSRLKKDQRAWWVAARVTPSPYMRPPYGAFNRTTLSAAGSTGFPHTVLWDVDPQDWRLPGASVIRHRVVSASRPGSIVVMHVLPETAAALGRIISDLRHHHLDPVSLADLLAAGRPARARPGARPIGIE